jgi:hypothetical protein
MKINEVRKAASDNAEKISNVAYSGGGHIGQDDLERAFENGAEWRINSVWHDVKEMPENNRMILIIMKHDIPTVLGPDNTFFREEIKDRHIQRWAYVEDLIPDKEE